MVRTQAGVDLQSFEYDRSLEAYRARYEPETMPPSMAVVATLSKATDSSPLELQPLGETIDTDALDQFFSSHENTVNNVSVSFTAEEHTVTVYDSGDITLVREDSRRPERLTEATDTR